MSTTMELATQISALVVPSLLLFWVTHPRHEDDETCDSALPAELRGIKQYSSYHRKRYYAKASSSLSSACPSS